MNKNKIPFLIKVVGSLLILTVILIFIDGLNLGAKISNHLIGFSPFSTTDRILSYLGLVATIFFSAVAYKFTAESSLPAIRIQVDKLGNFSVINEGSLRLLISGISQKRAFCTAADYKSDPSIPHKLLEGEEEILVWNGCRIAPHTSIYIGESLTHVPGAIEDHNIWFVQTDISGSDAIGRNFTLTYIHAWFNDPTRVALLQISQGRDKIKAFADFKVHASAGVQSHEEWSLISTE